ncbi:metal-dependent hydrolase [Cohnella luojiensis]|uniref:Metal-dependent hydrolase n=1 Tax=Cohnella luojiensis TaxID=652876 RepID=A0A4Y8LMZ1_9BACL|nr:metal-dependent hydrolase [Cohnella luojiensis]TFE19564.1 metal-dependent hydrolase [Cohnella luojiensis]
MTGKTHLAIGGVIGAAACLYYPFQANHAMIFLSVAGFSALSADLDGPSLLSGKIDKISKLLRELFLWGGIVLAAVLAYLYFDQGQFYRTYTVSAVVLLLLGFVTREGIFRNALVSVVGGVILYLGWTYQLNWLMGFGLFVGWVPWLDHRGMTHTIWALGLWGAIGWGLEKHLHIDGITVVAVAGYASHLLADTLTPQGVKWLYPIYKRSIKVRL